jgi:MFS family permease
MLDRLDRISDRAAYLIAAAGLGVSLLAAFLAPQDAQLGAWVRLVIWHGMYSAACIVGIFAMGAVAAMFLITDRDRLYEWGRALQLVMLPLWVVAMLVGAASARLVWNSWNLTERRMMVGIAYTVVAAIALMLALFWDNRRAGAVGQVVTALAMAAGLAYISFGPVGEDIHPASAVMSSPDIAFKLFAAAMIVGCVVFVLALAVPVRRWLAHSESAAETD